MYPKNSICDKVECLESLVGIRSACASLDCNPFWIEDIEGVDIKTLAALAKGSNLSGKDFGQQLINSAAREMLADIELMLNNGYNLQNTVGELCSTCTFLPTYTAGTGILVRSIVNSQYQQLHITKVNILANVSGIKSFTIDDGVDPKFFNVTLTAGVIVPVKLNYKTLQKSVKISFTDNTVPLGQIYCQSNSSCGCGGATNQQSNFIQINGLNGGNEVNTQYGIIPCAAVTCSFDALACNLIKQTPNIFGKSLLYKVGEKYMLHKAASNRNNEVASINEDDDKGEKTKNFGRLYWATMQGTKATKGVKNIISQYLAKNKDKCVICDAKIKTGHITG